jgi:rSAM/selenodomain-associated transferase 1
MSKNLLLVFTRNPELGKVKTRLAKTIGDQKALDIYKLLLHYTKKTIQNINCDKAVYYSEAIQENDIWENSKFQKNLQNGKDLGDRMCNAFKNAFNKDYEKVVVVGSDIFELQSIQILEAFKALDKHEVVIGPAKDGGYYLLGLKKMYSEIFNNKNWGTETIFQETMQDLNNVDVHLLVELNDIDTYDDLKQHQELLKHIQLND